MLTEKCQWKRNLVANLQYYQFQQDGWNNRIFFQEKWFEYEFVLKYLENLGYWENLILFWMMLNKVSAYLYTLVNDIYTEKSSSTNIYLFIVNNINTRKRCEICSKLTIKSPQRRSTVFIVNLEHISYIYHTYHISFWWFHCWLWTSKCFLGPTTSIYKRWNYFTAAIINRCIKIVVK